METLVYHKHVDEFHNKLNLAWELLRKIGALFDYRVFDPKGRFRWLNDPGFYSAIVTSVFEMMEANKKYRQGQKPPLLLGGDAVYLPASYIFYHAKFKLGRNLSRYIESLEVLSRHFPGSMAIINPGRKALQAYLLGVVDEKSPLKDEEFNFLLASIRNVGKDFLEAKQMRSLGFTESQINRYKFELKKHKLKWPYDVDSGRILKNKPKGFEKFIQEMTDCGLDQDVPRYRAALPIDWKVELQKFESMNTYNEFWNHLISLHSNPALSGSYEKQIKHHGLDRWIKLINSLDYPEAFESEIEQRLEAFSAISSLSEFLPSIATEKGGVENPLFFLQYTSSPDDFMENLNLVRVVEDFNILDTLRMKRILETNVFGPWKNEMQDKYQAITMPTPDQQLSHMTTMQEIGNLETQIGLDLVNMYEERVAFMLKGKTVQELKEFAELHTPEAKTTGAKGKLIQSILTELGLENTVIGQYLSK